MLSLVFVIQICSAIAVENQDTLQETVKELKMVSIYLYVFAVYIIIAFGQGDAEDVSWY